MFSKRIHKNLKIVNILQNAPKSGAMTFNTPIGDIKAPKDIISPVLECLSKQDRSFLELLQLDSFRDNPIFLIETIFLLLNANAIQIISENYTKVDNNFVKRFTEIMNKDRVKIKLLPDCATAII